MRMFLSTILVLVSCGASRAQLGLEKRNNSQSWQAMPRLPRNSSSVLEPLYQPYSNKTPVFKNNAVIQQLSAQPGARLDHLDPGILGKRQSSTLPTGSCAPGVPCTNGACCSNTGVCSYAPSSCGPDVCISDCDAKAPCGQYANPDNATCPLNVCCSQYGFCGSTDPFCGDGCQRGYGGCGPAPTPSCSSSGNSAGMRRIGYYESWAKTRPCDVFEPEDLELTGMTHINFAFSFFDPSSFQITPMDANAGSLYARFTALKAKQPGLQTWLSLGGWSFNDATNAPNTQNAFSNMVGSAANRQAFIASLRNFMQTYGFDGVDIDWEYPAADDRGGVTADFTNFPAFLAELRASFGSGLGISATLPSSYWYLRHFDLLGMEPSVDWFNFMSYDIHGVWDSTNKFTGPYIRPHTNLTEIEDGLSLLWRAGVDPSKVVLGLGWYGRSFTLTDPACNVPDGVCAFVGGGTAGDCTQSSGTLSNAEIKRILATGTGVESYDATAAVRWLTWNTHQWVSFDDGVTMQQKISKANSLCLGGIMIWSLDQDNAVGDSMNDLLGIGQSNGISEAAAESYKEQLANATLQKAIASSCYWSLCGGGCTTGYFDQTEARGQVADIQQNSVCAPGEFQTLCCAPGTTMGTCQWEGFRGVGFPCSPACNDSSATIVARNSNSYQTNEGGQTADLTCTGGYQAYCCVGFVPSSITNSGNLFLYGAGSKRDDVHDLGIKERGLAIQKRSPLLVANLGVLCLGKAPELLALGLASFSVSLAAEGAICLAAAASILPFIGYAILNGVNGVRGWLNSLLPSQPNTGVPTTIGKTQSSYGQWPILDFGGGATGANCDCVVTYTCRYGLGWDEVCDNQRWAINKMLNGHTAFHPLSKGRAANRAYSQWANVRTQRNAAYRTLVQGSRSPEGAKCELDEFPMGNLRESGNLSPQACRLVNGMANRKQGIDYKGWKSAQWSKCSQYRSSACNITDNGPPATWKFGPLNGKRGSGRGKHFIDAFGFDAQTPHSLCFASYTYTVGHGTTTSETKVTTSNTMIIDHGFRVLEDDPMYGTAYKWPRQSWRIDPAPLSNAKFRPYDIEPGIFQRGVTIVGNNTDNGTDSSPEMGSPAEVCHVDLNSDNSDSHVDADLDYDKLLFVDMDGNLVDGRTCGIIYEDRDPDSQVHIVLDEDGNVVDIYMGDDAGLRPSKGMHESPATATAEPAVLTATTGAARPASDELSPGFPASTAATATRPGSVVTLAPI
ncbi:hypothetical protein F4804DRAFT_341082 [Jackrogersella minutella]|nr:hypothetical protein F4804DRAFT_341082 [Jackrogersella minutella]